MPTPTVVVTAYYYAKFAISFIALPETIAGAYFAYPQVALAWG